MEMWWCLWCRPALTLPSCLESIQCTTWDWSEDWCPHGCSGKCCSQQPETSSRRNLTDQSTSLKNLDTDGTSLAQVHDITILEVSGRRSRSSSRPWSRNKRASKLIPSAESSPTILNTHQKPWFSSDLVVFNDFNVATGWDSSWIKNKETHVPLDCLPRSRYRE